MKNEYKTVEEYELAKSLYTIKFCAVWGSVIGFAIVFWVLLFQGCNIANAEECQDPSKLTPQLEQAYKELKEAGLDVSIRCTKKEYTMKITEVTKGKKDEK